MSERDKERNLGQQIGPIGFNNNLIFFSGPHTGAGGLHKQEYFIFNQRRKKQTLDPHAKWQDQ